MAGSHHQAWYQRKAAVLNQRRQHASKFPNSPIAMNKLHGVCPAEGLRDMIGKEAATGRLQGAEQPRASQ